MVERSRLQSVATLELCSVIATAVSGARTLSLYQPANATRWKRVEAEWRTLSRDTLPLAFTHLKRVL
jgi:hypothetical protein